MVYVYTYAKNQVFGMQFETFDMTTGGVTYLWDVSSLVRFVLAALLSIGWNSAAQYLFTRKVKVL